MSTHGGQEDETPRPEGLVAPGGPQPPVAPGNPWAGAPPSPPASPYPAYPAHSAYPAPYGDRHLPPPSRAMAGWALGLALVFCVPLLPLVGIILGIVVLARGRDGRNHGKGLAIAAVVVGGLAMLLQLLTAVGGFVEGFREGFEDGLDDTTRDESGEVVESGEMLPAKLRVGDCFDDEVLRNAGSELVESGMVQGIPCSDPHTFEVFGIIDVQGTGDGDDFPGQKALDAQATKCLPKFKRFVGISFAESDLDVRAYFPTEQSWRLLGDEAITCVAYDPDKDRVTGSLRNARR